MNLPDFISIFYSHTGSIFSVPSPLHMFKLHANMTDAVTDV